MNIDKRIEDAMARVDAMSVDEFEQELISYGFNPVRKRDFNYAADSVLTPLAPHKVIKSNCVKFDEFSTTFSVELEISKNPMFDEIETRFAA